MADEILIVDNTVEEITIEEFSGAPTGTIITTTHGMDKGDQHTIRDIVGLKTKLDNIESLKPVRSNLGGHADYYKWGEQATDTNPLGPGYFVRLDDNGMIHKCTNETTVLRPADLSLNTDENGKVVIYALAGNITNPDANKCYVVGTEVPYDIYAYNGVKLVQKSAYSYDGEQVIKTCHTTDVLGVTVSSAGFVGNDANIAETYTSAKAADVGYALVATTGVVDVLCDHSILVGDYVFPTVGGWAAKSTGSYGYLVTALVPSVNDTLYARIVLSPSMVNAKRVSDNVDYLLAETQRIGENVVKAVSDAQTALNEVRDSGNNLSDRVNNFESSMNAMGEQLYTNTVAVGNANSRAAEAERVARQAEEYVQEVANSATGGASEALAIAKTLEGEMKALSEDMDTYSSKIDTIEDNQSTQAIMISKANDDIAAVQTKATNLENSVTSLANKDTELANTMSLIDQKANEQGASITALTSKIDKYSVGEYSQAYGLTQAQAADILEAGKIVFIPTDFVSSDASFTERYNPIVLDGWSVTDKNPKYIYEVGGNYYYHNGTSWTSDTISNMQLAGYCVTNFAEGYSYEWNGLKWMPETASINVFFTDDAPATMSTPNPLYWVVGSGHCLSKTATEWSALTTKDPKKEYYIADTKKYYYYNGTTWTEAAKPQYKIGGLYLAVYNSTSQTWEWKECALGSSNSMSRVSALVEQTQNSWQTSISNVKGDMAALSAKVDENGSNVAMVASVVKEVEGVNLDFADNTEKTPYASKDDIISIDKTKYFVVGTKVPYDLYYYNGTTYVKKINWSYDGQRVLQPNTASIVTSANEDTSGIKLSADHITFEGTTYKVDAKYINFTGDDYKINADRIELAGSTTFSNYAQLEDVIKEQKVEYAKSTNNTILEGEVAWGADYPIRNNGEYIWRKTTVIKGDDTELAPIIECVTPADGKDGTSVKIKGSADEQPVNIGGGLYTIKFNGAIVTDGELGDGYMYGEPADLFVCVGVNSGEGEADHFSNVGQIQGPQGTSGASLQIIYKASDTAPQTPTGTSPTGWSPTMPTSGVIYMSQKLSNATVWSSPVRISGETGAPGSDGAGVKYVYYLIPEDKTLPTKPTFENGALVTITGWTEQPSGVTEKRQYEYVSVSTETQKVEGNESIQNWINFSDPVVWSKWGEKGQDGDGVEYLYCLQADNTNPPTITINYGDEPTSPWTDEPTGTSESKPYEYVIQVKSTDPKGSTYTGKLWGVYDGMMALYCASTSIPTTPVGAGSNASTSENTKWQINIPAISGSQSIWVSYKTFLGANWSTPIKASAKDGPTGATIKSIETYYLVTKTDNAPPDPESGVEEGSGKWNTSIENWGKKDGTDIYQYLWVREKMTMNDANSTVIWTDPRLDASMETIGNWCVENNKTLINGGNIAAGSITAQQMAADAIRSRNYDGTIEDGHITEYGTQGTMLNLKDGVFDSPHFKLNTNADFLESGNYTPNETGLKLNLSDGAIDSKNFKVDSDGAITATQGVIGGWEINTEGLVAFNSESGLRAPSFSSEFAFPHQNVADLIVLELVSEEDGDAWYGRVELAEECIPLSSTPIDITLNGVELTDSFQVIGGQQVKNCKITDHNKDEIYYQNIYVVYSACYDYENNQIKYKCRFDFYLPNDIDGNGREAEYEFEIPEWTVEATYDDICFFAGSSNPYDAPFSVSNLGYINMTQGKLGQLTLKHSGIESIINDISQFTLTQSGLKLKQDGASISAGGLSIYYDSKNNKARINAAAPVAISGSNETAIELMTDRNEELSRDYTVSLYANAEIKAITDVMTGETSYVWDYTKLRLKSNQSLIYPVAINVDYELWKVPFFGGSPKKKKGSGTLTFTINANNTESEYIQFDETSYYLRFKGVDKWSDFYYASPQTETKVIDVAEFTQGTTNKNIIITGNIVPVESNKYNLGESTASRRWQNIYATTFHGEDCMAECCTSSDVNIKNSIQSLTPEYEQIFDALRPVTFKYDDGTSGRTHIGMIAQEVEKAANDAGIETSDFAPVVVDDEKYYLRYSEFIALCIDQIQKLKARATEQENIINNLTNRLTALEEKLK